MAGMGTQGGTSERLAPDDKRLFPHPMSNNDRVTRHCDVRYNFPSVGLCMAIWYISCDDLLMKECEA
jgi:hypothetical protein